MVFDGRKLANKILGELKAEVDSWPQKPNLAVVSFGSKEENSSYIIQKKKTAEFLGFGFNHYHYAKDAKSRSDLDNRSATGNFSKAREYLNKIIKMEKNTAVVVQLPLPEGINYSILNVLPLHKDPDLLSDKAVGLFFNGRSLVDPPTAAAILRILDESNISVKNKQVALFGYGRLVGRFLAPLLIKKGAIVTVLEKGLSQKDILDISSRADIIISAIGEPGFITTAMVKDGAVVVDAGFSLLGGKITGDVDWDSVKDKASFITPVPGGVGPVAVAQLFANVTKLYKLSNKSNKK